jgi:hypothetical protein
MRFAIFSALLAIFIGTAAAVAAVNGTFSYSITPVGGTTNCAIGPSYTGAIPAAAIQAGFTTCAANYDFTQTGQWTDNAGTHQWSNLGSWFSCTRIASAPYILYYQDYSDHVPCDLTHQNITTDSGVQVFALTYTSADAAAGKRESGVQSQGSTPVVNMAGQYYIELVNRPSTNNTCSQFCDYAGLSTFTAVQGNPCFISTDMEWDTGSTGTGVGQAWWNPICGTSGSFNGGTCGGSTCATPVNGTINTSVNTWGNLTTGDGVSQSASCNYWSAGPVSGLPKTAFKSCFSNTAVPPFNSTAVFNTQPMYLSFWAGEQNNVVPMDLASSITHNIQRITVWQCPNYNNGPCITNPAITGPPS